MKGTPRVPTPSLSRLAQGGSRAKSEAALDATKHGGTFTADGYDAAACIWQCIWNPQDKPLQPEDIEREYQRRLAANPDANWGWFFMYTPEAALQCAKVVLVGLNPGGRQTNPQPVWEFKDGNAYFDQPWGADGGLNVLQRQVEALRSALNVQKDEIFAANLIPFRSPSWCDLPDQMGALAFGRSLWTDLLSRTPARLFVSLGKQSGEELASLLGARFAKAYDVDWARQSINEYVAADGRTVLALPHLSRFRIFGGSRTAAATAISGIAHRVLG